MSGNNSEVLTCFLPDDECVVAIVKQFQNSSFKILENYTTFPK